MGEARLIAEGKQGGVREALVGAFRAGSLSCPHTNASASRQAPGCWQVLQEYRSWSGGIRAGSAKS